MSKILNNRFFEFIPAVTVWLTLGGAIILSFIRPLWAIYFIIVFSVYWITRLFYMMVWLVISWLRYYWDNKVNWTEKITRLSKDYRQYYHVVTYPTYKEPYEVVRRSFQKLIETDFPKDRMMVVLGGEGRDKDNFLATAEKIKQEFGDCFFKLLITVHPPAADELPGKGSNVHYMEQQLKIEIDRLGLDYKKVIVSCFDIETLPHPQYFSYLTYKYLTQPRPERASYQPLILYNNNIWESNPIIRVVASATTFWLLTDLSRPERLLTFSSHSMSFQMLVDVGFHDKTIVTEDSRICLQGLVRYDGDYRVVPMFITLSMDTVYIGSFRQSLADQYRQMRRWAWGVEHFPWMWQKFFGRQANRQIPLKKRLFYFWNQFEGMYSWATAPLLILIVGRLPLWLASETDRATAFFQNAPYTLETLMMIGMVGLVINSILYTFMLPNRPKGYRFYNYIIMVVQWVIFPVTMVIFGSIPAADAQTRLLLGGKYRLGFWVTNKKV
ncbi:MAG TPA: glycosyltransferase family 2 protein [bacterium]|nr:glycosyltransferase family 2 protein [bacterium]HPN81466.1 glycosyltransferase family 2 protein [bacterium]HPW39709.1 glycosyltransferase family 2 protein [bacterium]